MSKRLTTCMALIAAWLCLAVTNGGAAQQIDFQRDVWPILKAHCIECHGASQQEGSLSMAALEGARDGGESGLSLLGGTVETNELLRRVTHDDPAERMPYQRPPLPADQIQTLRRWVQQGTPWPDATSNTTNPAASDTQASQATSPLRLFFAKWIRPYAVYLLALLVFIAAAERLKAIRRRESRRGEAAPTWVNTIAEHARYSRYAIVILIVVLAIAIDRVAKLEARLEQTHQTMAGMYIGPTFESVFGNPPVPIRPGHGKRLGGTYYRGNSERNEALYNNGYYLTATFDLALVDRQGRQLAYEDALDRPDDLRIRLRISPAPGATPVLFSDEIMSGLVLTTRYHPQRITVSADRAAGFQRVSESDSWEAFFPVAIEGDQAEGLVYLYRGERQASGAIATDGTPHVGIVYDLRIADSQISRQSELWMDAIYYPSEDVALPAERHLIPWTQWYDYRPMPIIEGANADDPDLLGISEYQSNTQTTPDD